jgi:hypothetical protein
MMPRNLVSEKILLSGFLSLALVGCQGANKVTPNNRLGQGPNGAAVNTIGNGQINPNANPNAVGNGWYKVGQQSCNQMDTNTQSASSPMNPTSICNPAVQQQMQAQQQQQQNPNQQVAQQQQGPMGPAVNPTVGNQNQQGTGYGQQQTEFPAVYPTEIRGDIKPDGRIVGNISRPFLLEQGAGEETVKDNCFVGTGKDADNNDMAPNYYHVERFLDPKTDKMQLTFDSRGNLIINLRTDTGTISSNNYVPYQLDADAQTIHFGSENGDEPLILSGKISQPYAEHENDAARVDKRNSDIELKRQLSIEGPFPDDFPGPGGGGTGSNGSGFVLGPQASNGAATTGDAGQQNCTTQQPVDTYTTNDAGEKPGKAGNHAQGVHSKKPATQNLVEQEQSLMAGTSTPSCQPTAIRGIPSSRKVPNRSFMMFPSGITAKILTHPSQPQHITSMSIEKVSFTSKAFIQSPTGKDCDPEGSGSLHRVIFK